MAGYGSDGGFEEWLAVNGYDLDSNPTPSAVLRQRGSAYVDALYASRFPGIPTGGLSQERAWPRTGAYVNDALVDSDEVPLAVINASYAAAYKEGLSAGSLAVVVTPSAQVKREKIGAIEVEYAIDASGALANATPLLSAVDGLLGPLFYQPTAAVFIV